MNFRSTLLLGAAIVLTGALVAQGQVPGVNSTLNSVFTLAYDQSTMKPTYSASSSLFTVASAATDVCTLQGSATRVVKVRRVLVAGNATAQATEPVEAFKRSTAATTGTSVILASVPYDSINAASGAVAERYSVNPTVGTVVGLLQTQSLTYAFQTIGAPIIFTFGALGQPVVLRGVAQNLAINLAGLTVAGAQITCTFEWTEE